MTTTRAVPGGTGAEISAPLTGAETARMMRYTVPVGWLPTWHAHNSEYLLAAVTVSSNGNRKRAKN